MTRTLLLALAVTALPLAAFAMPTVGDIVGTNPTAATAALARIGCAVTTFEAEGGKIEAKCTESATGKRADIYIDPKSGAVTDVKAYD